MPFVNPDTVDPGIEVLRVLYVAKVGSVPYCTKYPVMGRPPSDVGAVQLNGTAAF